MSTSRTQFTIILIVATVSLGGSYLLFWLTRDSDVWGTTNHGAFVQPAVTWQDLGLHFTDQAPPVDERTWWIWMVAQDCREDCQLSVEQMRSLHILLNREANRLRRAFTGDVTGLEADEHRYPLQAHTLPPNGDGIYVIDPIGNLVFHYAFATDPALVLADLKKLLKVSQIG